MTSYATINDLIDAIEAILGEFSTDYDLEGIAREVMDWEDGHIVADLDRPDFWVIAMRHDKTAVYKYYAYVSRMLLTQDGDSYTERDEDENTGTYYSEEYFDTEEEAVAFVRREMAEYVDRELDGRGYRVIRTRRPLDTVAYCEGAVERHLMTEDDVVDYGNDPKTEHYYEGYYESSLPDSIRDAAMECQRDYHRFLDYKAETYYRLSDMLTPDQL